MHYESNDIIDAGRLIYPTAPKDFADWGAAATKKRQSQALNVLFQD